MSSSFPSRFAVSTEIFVCLYQVGRLPSLKTFCLLGEIAPGSSLLNTLVANSANTPGHVNASRKVVPSSTRTYRSVRFTRSLSKTRHLAKDLGLRQLPPDVYRSSFSKLIITAIFLGFLSSLQKEEKKRVSGRACRAVVKQIPAFLENPCVAAYATRPEGRLPSTSTVSRSC